MRVIRSTRTGRGPGLGRGGRGSGGSPAFPGGTPTLTLTTGQTDNTPGFTLVGDLAQNDLVRFQYSTSAVFAGASESTNTIDADEDATNELDFSTGTLADGTWYFRARIERTGYLPSAWSNTQTETIDTTAPTLSSPTGTKTGVTTADLSVSTNEANGTLYGVVVLSSDSAPVAAQIIAGHNAADSAAAYAHNQSVSSAGVQTMSATALTGGTSYKAYYTQVDAVGNTSAVSGSSTFTTDAANDAATTAWVAAVVSAGGSVSATQQTNVDTLIRALKAASLWSTDGVLDHLWLYAGESEAHQASIDIVGLLAGTVHGTPTSFTASGYKGDASTFYIDTGLATNAAGNFGNNHATLGSYLINRGTTNGGVAVGVFTNVQTALATLTFFDSAALGGVGIAFVNPPSGVGMFTATIDASNGIYYYNTTSIASVSSSAQTYDSSHLFAFARDDGSPSSFSDCTQGALFSGGHLNPTQLANFYNALQAYMTSWGVNV